MIGVLSKWLMLINTDSGPKQLVTNSTTAAPYQQENK